MSRIRKVPIIYVWATIIALFVLFTGLMSSRFFTNIAKEDEIEKIRKQGELIASVVKPEDLGQFKADSSDILNPKYNELKSYFVGFCTRMNDIRYIYLFGKQQNKIFFYLDTEAERYKSGAKRGTAFPGEVYTDAPPEFDSVFASHQALVVNPYSDQWGSFISVLVPIIDKQNNIIAAIGVDVEVSQWEKTLHAKRMFPVVVSLIFIALIVLISVFLRIRIDVQTETLDMFSRFQSLLNNSQLPLILFSLDYKVLFFNKSASRYAEIFMNGSLRVGKIITDSFKDEELKARFIDRTQELLSKNHFKVVIEVEGRIYSLSYTYVQQNETDVPFISLTMEDITKDVKEKDERNVLLTEQSFLTKQYQYALFLVDHDLKIIQANSWVYERTGFSASALNGKHLDVLMESESLERFIKEIENPLRETVFPLEMVFHYKSNYLSDGVTRLTKIMPVKSSLNKIRYLFFCTDTAMISEPLMKAKAELDSALTIIDDLPGFVYRCKNDSFWTMLYLSRGFEDLTGYPIADVLNNNRLSYNELIAPEYHAPLVFKWKQSFLNRSIFEEKYEIVTANGERKWVWERGYALFDEDANVTELNGFITDISDLQLSFQMLEEESVTLKSYIDYSPHGMFQIDADMNIIRANITILGLLDYDLEFVRSQKLSFIVHPDSLNNYAVFVKKLVDVGSSSDELMVLTKSNAVKYVKMDALRFEKGDYIVYIVDNTQKHESQSRLVAQERFMQSILDTISVPFAVVNSASNTILYSNLGFNELLDNPLERLIGLSMNPNDLDEMPLIPKVAASLKGEAVEYEKSCEGATRYYQVNAVPMNPNADNAKDVLIFLFDISKFKMSDQNLQLMLQKSESIILAKNDFFATLSHEIRTPLNGIIGISELLINSAINDFQLQYLNLIKDSSLNLINMINSILDYSRIESGKIELVFEPFYPENLLNSLSMLFTQMCDKKGIELNLFIDNSANIQLVSDEIRIRQLLINIVGNAIRYTETGFISVSISIRKKNSHALLVMKIADSGIGFSPDKVDSIFDSIIQIRPESKDQLLGAGLGLSICKNIVEILKGSISFESKEGVGSNFNVEIPVELSESKDSETVYPKFNSMNVLLVVLNETERNSIKKMLLGSNVSVKVCENGIEALQIISETHEQQKSFDFVFVDYLIDGITCLEVIKTVDFKMKGTAVVILSKLADYENAQKMRSLTSVRQVLAKPILPSALIKAMQSNPEPLLIKPRALDFVFLPSSTILIVEDNSVNMLVLKEILAYSSSTIIEAFDGQDAYIKFLSNRPQIIFMDIHMPIMDGFEVTKLIRNYCAENPEFVKPFIVALTAEVFKTKKEIYLNAGMDDYISKPFKIEDIKNCLQQYLKNQST
jgi:PAS domain S-box-containing protein